MSDSPAPGPEPSPGPDATLISSPLVEVPTQSSFSPQERTSAGETKPLLQHNTVVDVGSPWGPYPWVAKWGAGGRGAVYKARHVKLGKFVAMKILPQHVMSRPDALARFEREMLAVGALSHPNVVQAHDAGEFNGVHYLSMEYVEGQDLQELVKTKGPVSVVNACKAIRQAAQGLAAAHKMGLVHRDIKPSNLFVTKQTGQIKILDMGLALLSQEEVPAALTSTGQCFGTPDYMAPEQWNDAHTCDARADLYSLGCTLFFLLVGHPPYHSETHRTAANKMKGHVIDPIPDLRSARQDIPDGVDAIYRKLLAKEPKDRFASAAELAEALAPFTKPAVTAPREESRTTNSSAKPADSDQTQPHPARLPDSGDAPPNATVAGSEVPAKTLADTATWKPTPAPSQGVSMPQMLVEPPNTTREHQTESGQFDWLSTPVASTTGSSRSSRKRNRRWSPLVVGLGVVGLIVLAAAYVIRVQTPQGELVIQSDVAGIAVKITSDGKEVVKDWKIVKGDNNKQLIRTGKIEIELPAELAGEFTVTPNAVTLVKGKQEIVKIERKELPPRTATNSPPHVALTADTTVLTGAALDRQVAEWALKQGWKCFIGDLDSVKNVWLNPGDALPPGPIHLYVVHGNETMKNADLQKLAGLQQITELNLVSSGVDDGAIPYITRLKSLHAISCYQTSIRTSALSKLHDLPFLTQLTIRGEQVDDKWEFLASLDSLWSLRVSGFVPGSHDFEAWAKFPQLHSVSLDSTEPIDATLLAEFQRKHPGCRIVAEQPQPQVLGVDPVRQVILQLLPKGIEFELLLNNQSERRRVTRDASNVPPAGQYFYLNNVHFPRELPLTKDDLLPLANCHFDTLYVQGRKQADDLLRSLPPRLAVYEYNLSDSDLTDEGLKQLYGISWLKDLIVTNTRVTEGGVKEFHAKNPHTEITSDFGLFKHNWSGLKPSAKSMVDQTASPSLPAELNSRPVFMNNRKTAEWVLGRGGELIIEPGWSKVRTLAELPKTPFVIRDLWLLQGSKADNLELEMFKQVSHLRDFSMSAQRPTDGLLPVLQELPRLWQLQIESVEMRTSRMDFTKPWNSLVYFYCWHECVDDNWQFVERCPSLQHLRVSGTADQLPDLTRLSDFPQLRRLWLHDAATVSEQTVMAMHAKNPHLRIVVGNGPSLKVLGRDPVRDATLALVGKGVKLHATNMQTGATDVEMSADNVNVPTPWLISWFSVEDTTLCTEEIQRHLPPLASGEYLTLQMWHNPDADEWARSLSQYRLIWSYLAHESKLTDAGLAHLHHVIDIRNLNVVGTNVTRAGLERFRRVHPTCTIESDFGKWEPDFEAVPEPLAPAPAIPAAATSSVDRQAAEWVLAHGGSCMIADVESQKYVTLKPGDELPKGPIYLQVVTGAETMKNSDLENLAELQNITRLNLAYTGVDNDAIPHVARLKSLLAINCNQTSLRSSSLTEARPLPFLTELGIGRDQVDDDWAFLGSLDALWTLSYSPFVPGSQEFAAWAKYPQLHTIVSYTGKIDPVEAAAVAELQRKHPTLRIIVGLADQSRRVLGTDPVRRMILELLPKGIEFGIHNDNFTEPRRVTRDAPNVPPEGEYFYFSDVHLPRELPLTQDDLRPLAHCNFDTLYANGRTQADALLKVLPPRLAVYDYNLSGSDLTDDGLKQLHGIAWLKGLVITKTRVTEDGVKEFHSKNPHCHITSDFGYVAPNWSAPKPSRK